MPRKKQSVPLPKLCITDPKIVQRVTALAAQCGSKSAEQWATQVLGDWILVHRSGRPYQVDPAHYDARNEDDAMIYDVE